MMQCQSLPGYSQLRHEAAGRVQERLAERRYKRRLKAA